MPSFVFSSLFWLGLPLVGIPVIIHLINMMRHRRVKWAAMEFLLISLKRNRTWVLLKQLLLLLLRMAALAVLVLVVAQPKLYNALGDIFGSSQTHHIIVLDDSFSMSDRWAGTTAFAEGLEVVRRIGKEVGRPTTPQAFTLLRTSRSEPDLAKVVVDDEFGTQLEEVLLPMGPSQSAREPERTLDAIAQLLSQADNEHSVVYLVSDFRTRQWEPADDLREKLRQLTDGGAQLHLVNCVGSVRPNLAISSLTPGQGARAVNVPLDMQVTVKNFSAREVRDVQVELSVDDVTKTSNVTIARIPPGGSVTEHFDHSFSTAGEHTVEARLPSDHVAADNVRHCIIDCPPTVPVLLVDGNPEQRDVGFFAALFAHRATGISLQVEPPEFLGRNPLEPYRVIYLFNLDRLDRSAVTAVEEYVKGGGGLAVFLGPDSMPRIVNDEFHRQGQGMFPVPLDERSNPRDLLAEEEQEVPDLELLDHPVLARLHGEGSRDAGARYTSWVSVRRYFAVAEKKPAPEPEPTASSEEEQPPESQSTPRVMARLRNGAPLLVERKFGKGRVVACMTTAGPWWNNIARTPIFGYLILELQSYLANPLSDEMQRLVDAPLVVPVDTAQFQPAVEFSMPEGSARMPLKVIAVQADAAKADAAPTNGDQPVATLEEVPTSGIYRAKLTVTEGGNETRHFAVNVDAKEGDLNALATGEAVAQRLDKISYTYHEAERFHFSGADLGGYNLSDALLYALIFLLVAEQIMAWSTSYHPPSPPRAGAKGGARR